MSERRGLLTFEFAGLCAINFVVLGNITIFYDLFGHLAALGIPAGLRGLVVGAYSLTAMVLYLVASPFVNAANGLRVLGLGLGIMALSGVSYLGADTFGSLLLLRMFNGAGQFCASAGAVALLVSVIPPQRSGQAFGVYTTANLLAYSVVPTVMDLAAPAIPSRPQGYALATLSLLPAAWIAWRLRGTRRARPAAVTEALPGWAEIRANVSRRSVVLLLLLNTAYFVNWSSLYFLFKGFAEQEGMGNVGLFFGVQMGVMIAVRLLGGPLLDRVDKVALVAASFATIALSHVALDHLPGIWAVPAIAALVGLGQGAGFPALNGLMFEVSPPRLRALDANLMLFAMQAGSFLGPAAGGALVAAWGYRGYFRGSVVLASAAAVLSGALAGATRRTSRTVYSRRP